MISSDMMSDISDIISDNKYSDMMSDVSGITVEDNDMTSYDVSDIKTTHDSYANVNTIAIASNRCIVTWLAI